MTISTRSIALRMNIPPTTLYHRLRYGMTAENRREYEQMKAGMERERRELIERGKRVEYQNKWRVK